ncbi:hypothetical protein HRbin37_01305 [bacterium HR37]|jgi:hypothetical protein|nr:hypothetical protein HRbin37_01305 [bacterium HR37]
MQNDFKPKTSYLVIGKTPNLLKDFFKHALKKGYKGALRYLGEGTANIYL